MISCDFIFNHESLLTLSLPAVPRTFETIEFGEFPSRMFEVVGVHHSVSAGAQAAKVYLMDAAVTDTRVPTEAVN